MTVSERPGTGLAPAPAQSPDVLALSEELGRLMRSLNALKGQLLARTGPEDRDRAAHILLLPLILHGPVRQGSLAEMAHADPSTVSRHVSLLVQRGLVQRVADEHDGRATRLVVTPAGEETLASMRREREVLLAQVTASWSQPDLRTFAALLGRFVDDLGDHLSTRAAAGGTGPLPSEKDR